MHVIIVSGVVVRLSHVEPKVSGWNPASYPFFFPFVFLFCFSFLFCFDCLFVLLLFLKYIPSRAKIVYLRINNLNFYRFLRLKFLFYCNIFYKPKTVATCSHSHEMRLHCLWDEVWDREAMFSQLAKQSPRGGQRILQYFSQLKKIISCIFVFLAYRICLSVLKLRGKPC